MNYNHLLGWMMCGLGGILVGLMSKPGWRSWVAGVGVMFSMVGYGLLK